MNAGDDGVETRELAYFVAVAEELHFGRAARRLGIAQPPLSRAIQRLERRLGTRLLDRDSRTVTLTEAGETLLREGRAALAAVSAAVRRTRRAGRSEPSLVLAAKPDADADLLPVILTAYAATPDALPVDIVFSARERGAMVRDGRADAALMHAPREDLTGLAFEDLLTETQVAVLPRRHPLAARAVLSMADLDREPLPRWPPRAAPDGSYRMAESGQLMHLIALGRAVAVVPESVRANLRHDLVGVPVADAPPTTLVLAWPEGSRSRALAAFVRSAAEAARTARPAPAAETAHATRTAGAAQEPALRTGQTTQTAQDTPRWDGVSRRDGGRPTGGGASPSPTRR
ncbi:LysR family transcriptional regulator [Microbispora triticiradicis]|uniref:LysR family transcriptional regulator n=1 Tax=Microbispora triticiradicis TaxID=2200763 RepID=UPI001AD73357|nr:LysR family transcriptional regulator [Microbispora triticiradicis]MBO4270021.1 LysR family transcriptional regulator [Microbispora triticiradicis]